MRYQVRHRQQKKTTTCWWWAIKMIRDFHAGRQVQPSALSQFDKERHENAGMHMDYEPANSPGMSPEVRKCEFPTKYNMPHVPTAEFSPSKCSAKDLVQVLQKYGPVYVVGKTAKFAHDSNHAFVLSGADTEGGTPEYPGQVWLNDPSSEAAENPRLWIYQDFLLVIGYLKEDRTPADPDDPPLWYCIHPKNPIVSSSTSAAAAASSAASSGV